MIDACRAAKTCATIADLLPSLGEGAPVPILLLIVILLLFAVLVLAWAVWIALRRDPWIGLRARHPQPDPFAEPHGDVPRLDFFSAPAPPRNRPRSLRIDRAEAATGATETGGRAIPSCAPAGRSDDGARR